MKLRDLTLDDVQDLLDMEGTPFDILVATAARAKEIYEFENREATPPPPPLKIKIKRSAATRTSGGSSSSAARAKHSDEIENQEDSRPSPSSKIKIKRYAAAPRTSDGIAAKKKKQRSIPKKRKIVQYLHQPSPPLPEEFKKAIEEMAEGRNLTAPRLVIQKELTATDLSSAQCRLSMPISQLIIDNFLTDEEKRNIRSHDGMRKRYVDARLVEPSTATAKVKITQWDMAKGNGGKTSSSYVINGTWKDIVKRNKLIVDTPVQVWSFRVDRELCFALVCLPINVAGDDDDDDDYDEA